MNGEQDRRYPLLELCGPELMLNVVRIDSGMYTQLIHMEMLFL